MIEKYQVFINRYRKVIFWSSQLLIWTAYFLFDIVIIHRYSLFNVFQEGSKAILYPLIYCYFGLPLSILLKVIFDRVLERMRSISILFLMGVGLPIILAHIWYLLSLFLDKTLGHFGYANPLVDYFWDVFLAALILIAWSAIYLFVRFFEQWIHQRHETEQAILRAENAQLKALRYQLNPHFLFNSLSSLRALIREDQERATGMVSKLSDILRYSLIDRNDMFVTLEEEVKAIRNYVDMESIRFEDNLEVIYSVDNKSLTALIPAFIIHPLVENALKYGMQTSTLPLRIKIKTESLNSSLMFWVSNSGSWVPEGEKTFGTGTGLKNIRARLSYLYPSSHRFEIDRSKDEVRVFIEIDNVNHAEKDQSINS